MPVPKQPPAMKDANGRNPGRDSGGREIQYGPEMGTPDEMEKPDYLTGDASALWDILVTELKGSGIIRSVDATGMANLCETYSRWREAVQLRRTHGITSQNRLGDTVRAPWVTIEAEAVRELRAWLREFGLTPSAVSSLIQRQPPVDPLDDPFEWSQ